MSNIVSMNQSAILAQNVFEIKKLGKRVTEDIIKIGRILSESKLIIEHGKWEPWLEKEFRWSKMQATRYINIFEMSKSNKLLDLDLPMSSLSLLAAPSTPESVRSQVLAKAESGSKVTHAEVKKAVSEARPMKKSTDDYRPALEIKQQTIKNDDEVDKLKEENYNLLQKNKKLLSEVESLTDKIDELLSNLKLFRLIRKSIGDDWDNFLQNLG